MLVRLVDKKLARLEIDLRYSAGFGSEIVKAFRKRMQLIRAAKDERDFYALKSLHYKKLSGDRRDQRSMRLNVQFRLILAIEQTIERAVVVIGIKDYHESEQS